MANYLSTEPEQGIAPDRAAATAEVRAGDCEAVVADIEGVTLATISGSIDATSVDDFVGHLAVAAAAGTGRLVVDMSYVDFLCVDGIAALHDLARYMTNSGGALAVSGGRAVSRPLRRTGLDGLVPVFDWLPMAFDAVGGGSPT